MVLLVPEVHLVLSQVLEVCGVCTQRDEGCEAGQAAQAEETLQAGGRVGDGGGGGGGGESGGGAGVLGSGEGKDKVVLASFHLTSQVNSVQSRAQEIGGGQGRQGGLSGPQLQVKTEH